MNEPANEPLPEFQPLMRAARIIAPIAQSIDGHYLDGAARTIVQWLGEHDIAAKADRPPPAPPLST